MSCEEFVDIVDVSDGVLGSKARSRLVDGVDRWRIVVLCILSADRQRVLLVRRASTKRHDPGRWAPPVAGTVASGDTYDETILRETIEEIGVAVPLDQLAVVHHAPLDAGDALRNAVVYLLVSDVDLAGIVLDPAEADHVAWFDLDSVLHGALGDSAVPTLARVLRCVRPV